MELVITKREFIRKQKKILRNRIGFATKLDRYAKIHRALFHNKDDDKIDSTIPGTVT